MPSHRTLRALDIFLASPGDLHDERRAAKEVVELVNSTIGHEFGWRVTLLGWEDTLPGFSRPQALINKDVDRCHLFIGMLWRRWGEPTRSGMHSSGFQEEFERALERRRGTEAPEIWLFFKDIDPDQANDPGDQLKQVLTFREAQRAAKQLYYKDFRDFHSWSKTLQECLLRYVSRLAARYLERRNAKRPSRFIHHCLDMP